MKRDEQGQIIIGRQYQNHNPTPGPVYAGTGYTDMSSAVHDGADAVRSLVARVHPEDVLQIVNEVSTGGATPLHTCGMSRQGQTATAALIELGANIETLDT